MEKKVTPPSVDEYEREELRLRLQCSPRFYPCEKCGWPVRAGYCCNYCGDTNPSEPPKEK